MFYLGISPVTIHDVLGLINLYTLYNYSQFFGRLLFSKTKYLLKGSHFSGNLEGQEKSGNFEIAWKVRESQEILKLVRES